MRKKGKNDLNTKSTGQSYDHPNFNPYFFHSFRELFSNNSNFNPYKDYIWVYACTSIISRLIRRLPISFYSYKTNEQIDLPKYDKLFRRPNGLLTRSDFIESIVLNILSPTKATNGGQSFLFQEKSEAVSFCSDDVPKSLFVYNDSRVTPNIIDNRLQGWDLNISGDKKEFHPLDTVLRIKLTDPDNLLRGLSPYSAASKSVSKDVNADTLTDNLYSGGGVFPGLLKTDLKLSPDQRSQILEGWKENYGGVNNTGKIPLLHSGLDYKELSSSVLDIDLTNQKKLSREEVIAAYQVPKFMLGLTDDINRATAETALNIFWENTLIPYCEIIEDAFNSQWFEFIGNGDIRFYLDRSNVDALKKDYTAKIINAKELIDQGAPASQVYKNLDLPTIENAPWLDQPLVKGARINLSNGETIGGYSSTPLQNPIGGSGEEKSTNNNLIVKSFDRVQYWENYISKSFDQSEQLVKRVIAKFFNYQQDLVLNMIDEWVSKTKNFSKEKSLLLLYKAILLNPSDFLFSKEPENKRLKNEMDPVYKKLIKTQAKHLKSELKDIVKWNEKNPSVIKFTKKRLETLQDINSTTFKKLNGKLGKVINEIIAQDIQGGQGSLTVLEIASKLKDVVKTTYEIRINNSETIARTETGTIFSETRYDIFLTEGIEKHEWVSAHDETVRDTDEFSHIEADEEVVNVGTHFKETGEDLLFPQDPSGSPGNVINCRCVALPVT